MVEGLGAEKLRLELSSLVRARTPDGEDCTPRGRKARAVLAMLATAPEFSRSRAWLQEKLWGSRAREQAAGSLRQAVIEIRRAFGAAQDALAADHSMLALDLRHIEIDRTHLDAGRPGFLEELVIAEPGYREWLAVHQARRPGLTAATGLLLPGENGLRLATSERNRLVLLPRERGEFASPVPDAAQMMLDDLLDTIGKSAIELNLAEVIDRRHGAPGQPVDMPGHGAVTLTLRADIAAEEAGWSIRLALTEAPSNALVWSARFATSPREMGERGSAGRLRNVNQAVMMAVEHFLKTGREQPPASTAYALCYTGIRHLFRLGRANYDKADRYFESAYALEPRGIYLAWRAYLRTFLIAERQNVCRQTAIEEAQALMRQAMELDPHNSYVMALGAHVHSIMGRSYVAAYELAEQSTLINPSNPIGWATLGIAKCYLGQSQEGFRHTLLARSIAGMAPFRFQLDALSCIAGSMAGQFDEATRFGEMSHALSPEFAAPLRYLSALYLQSGQHERSHGIVEKLRAIEPDFSYEKLREYDYPAAGLRTTNILDHLPTRQF